MNDRMANTEAAYKGDYTLADPYRVIEQPRYVGAYCIGGQLGLCVHLKRKPVWLHRKMMTLAFGWEWFDK